MHLPFLVSPIHQVWHTGSSSFFDSDILGITVYHSTLSDFTISSDIVLRAGFLETLVQSKLCKSMSAEISHLASSHCTQFE